MLSSVNYNIIKNIVVNTFELEIKMNNLLAFKLIEKGAIRQGTEIEARYNAHGLSCAQTTNMVGSFIVEEAVRKDGTIILKAAGGNPYGIYRFGADEILSLDGMDLARFCSIYNLDVYGNDIIPGKRRGRRPKNWAGATQSGNVIHFDFCYDDEDDDEDESEDTERNFVYFKFN